VLDLLHCMHECVVCVNVGCIFPISWVSVCVCVEYVVFDGLVCVLDMLCLMD
jgi:hypothetical protein